MSWVIKLMNIAAPIAALVTLLFIFPLYFAFDILWSIKKRFSSENVAGKVLLITGASSGIGESLAYEYGKRGARLALAARIEDRLQLEVVAKNANKFGSPDLLAICVNVSKPHDCFNLVDQTVQHFGQLDCLVNNAGIADVSMFEDYNDISHYTPIMDVNFWGSVYCTHSAIPHLRKTNGKIVVISSVACWLPTPKLSFYSIRFSRNLFESSEVCAKAIVDSACRGDRYLTVPTFYKPTFLVKLLAPELQEWVLRSLVIRKATGFKKHV